jgi:hypothetical protein
MNLHRAIINEGYGEQQVVLTLDEIIKAGKVTNPYQTYVLCWLSEHFRGGNKPLAPGLRPPGALGATSTAVVESIKSLTPEETVSLAQFLKDCMNISAPMAWGSDLAVADWMKFVLRRQD